MFTNVCASLYVHVCSVYSCVYAWTCVYVCNCARVRMCVRVSRCLGVRMDLRTSRRVFFWLVLVYEGVQCSRACVSVGCSSPVLAFVVFVQSFRDH